MYNINCFNNYLVKAMKTDQIISFELALAADSKSKSSNSRTRRMANS